MDTLNFEKMLFKSQFSNYDMELGVTIINGRPLADIVEPFEREVAHMRGEDYSELGYIYQLAHILYKQLIRKNSQYSEDEVALMICSGCYEEGCWALLVTIEETETEVIWTGFRNNHRSDPEYNSFPILRFEKNNYIEALLQLKETA